MGKSLEIHGRDHRSGGADPIREGKFGIKVNMDTDTAATGDGQASLFITEDLNGTHLVDAQAFVSTVSSSGALSIQIRNVTQAADMLSTKVTIDVSEKTSYTAAQRVIDTANDDVATGDEITVDVDGAGTGAKGLYVTLRFA